MAVAWWSILPFALLLACIAVLPLIPATEKIWDRNLVKLVVALVLGVPIAVWFVIGGYVVWSLTHLVSILASMVLLFMTEGVWWKQLGVLAALLVLGKAGMNVRAGRAEAKMAAASGDRASERGE
ncbi:hypothetical protein [Brevibacterium marinum]|uniref:Putative membrane protein n=1 Tax=Brevibacterium marinum TaxID=418643 RepID=A0A846RSV0_9MICO|nr:hypothetical protein [Brevibacterium marinum]NJC57144.1 putative membrane protein [Brevibacterium marinum]